MKRLLCIVSRMDAGGAETFLMKIYRRMDRSMYQMDFCVGVPEKSFYDDEIRSLGGRIFFVPPKSNGLFREINGIKEIVRSEHYDYVLRMASNSAAVIELIAARLGGARHLCMRSANASVGTKKELLLHKVFLPLTRWVPTVKIAPSAMAADFMFGKKADAARLNNGIAVEDFAFSQNTADFVRSSYGFSGKFVIGCVARMVYQKNHSFLLDIFSEIKKLRSDAILFLIGDGELKQQLFDKAVQLGISGSVIFAGVKKNINELLMAMDVYVMPSFFEGMPNTVIEAQATGLNCFISENITPEANVTGNVYFLPLGNAKKWADAIVRTENGVDRTLAVQKMIDEHYDINGVVDRFIELVF